MAAITHPAEEHEQTVQEAVLSNNLGNEWLDANDEPGNAGEVLTSQGPGKEPLWLPGGGGTGGGPGISVIDNLTSTSTTAALSANQGRVLEEMKANDGPVGGSRITAKPAKLIGNPTATEGPIAEITVGTGLTLTPGGVLSADGGAGVTDLSVTNRTAVNLTVDSSTGADAVLPAATQTLAGLMTGADKAKLDGVSDGATANRPDAELVDLGNATGTLPGSQLGGLYTAAGLTISAPQKLLGRVAAGAGKAEEITVGPGLELAAGVLSVPSGGAVGATNLTTTNVTATTVQISSDTGTDAVIPAATGTTAGLLTAADKTKIDAIPADADFATPDWDAAPGADGEILNKPPIPDSPDDIGAASQADLDALEAVVAALPAPVKPDWNAVAGTPAEILNKPVLGTAAAENVGVPGGVPPLDATGKVPAAYLPSYVDDVIEVVDYASLPATGESGVVYVTLDTGTIWRWGGTSYVEISASPGTTDAVPEGTTNLYYTDERAQAVVEAEISKIPAPVLPVATAAVLGGVKIGSGITVSADGTISAEAQAGTGTDLTYSAATRLLESSTGTDVTLPLATGLLPGLMSAADKAAVDAIEAPVTPDWNAAPGDPGEILNKPTIPPEYTLVPATATVLGGVKVGTGITVAADGTISAEAQAGTGTDLSYVPATRLLESSTGTDATLPLVTTTVDGLMAAADKVKLDGAASDADLTALEDIVAGLPAPVKPDWTAAAGSPAEILNKPPLGTAAAKDVAVANGVCPLDATSKVPAIHLPSYVDDVIEVANEAALPTTGAADIIYVTIDTNAIYRWSGTGYVEISPSPGTTDDVPEGTSNLYYTDARAQALIDASITAADIPADTDDLPEGTANLYFTDQRAQDLIDASISKIPAPETYTLPPATTSALGGLIVGVGFKINAAGLLALDAASLPVLP